MPFLPMHWLYRRLGKHYPLAFYGLLESVGLFVTLGTVALATFYYDAGSDELVDLAIASELLTVTGLGWVFLKVRPRVRPITAWIGGRRDRESTLAAWDAAVNLPVRIFRHDVLWPCVFVITVGAALTVYVFDVSWIGFLPAAAAAAIAVSYSSILQYFGIEVGLRPVVDEIAESLPREFGFTREGLPLRTKILTILPLINVITGFVVAAFTQGADRSSLALAVLGATAVAFTLSFELTLLLSRSIMRPLTSLTDAMAEVQEGHYGVRVPVTTSDELGGLTDGFNRMAAGLAERERLREAFGTYLDRDVAEYIIGQGVNPQGVEVDVSILFCDVRGFTEFASGADATEVVDRLNTLFEAVVPVVAAHGGHVDKFQGDGLLAFFGTPEPYEDHADRAVAAAMEMARIVAGGEAGDLRVGIGVNSGRVVAGSIGGAGRLNFSVIGDPVNVAARVEATTRETGDDVLITADTHALLRRGVPVVSRGAFALKGKAEPVELFAVGEAAAAPGPPLRAVTGA